MRTRDAQGYYENEWPTLSQAVEQPKLRILSLGAGVQSSTLALMAARGDIGPMPDAAIFADTGWEPEGVYKWLDWLETQLPFPVYRVNSGNIRDDIAIGQNSTGQRFASLPFHIKKVNGENALARRQCTAEYKIEPVRRKTRELIGLQPRQRAPKEVTVEQWIGISKDEIERVRDARDPWIKNRWPLIEASMTRQDCLRWMELHQYPLPAKSACIGCPYRDDQGWMDMKETDPVSFADAVEVDHMIRQHQTNRENFTGELYLHRSLKPLDEVDFKLKVDPRQRDMWSDGFINECEGMCGL